MFEVVYRTVIVVKCYFFNRRGRRGDAESAENFRINDLLIEDKLLFVIIFYFRISASFARPLCPLRLNGDVNL